MRLFFEIAVTVFSSSWLGYETSKEHFGPRINLPFAHQFTTLFLSIAKHQSEKFLISTSFYNIWTRGRERLRYKTFRYCTTGLDKCYYQ